MTRKERLQRISPLWKQLKRLKRGTVEYERIATLIKIEADALAREDAERTHD